MSRKTGALAGLVVFQASSFFLFVTLALEWWRPGFVVLFVPLAWILGVVIVSGCIVAFFDAS